MPKQANDSRNHSRKGGRDCNEIPVDTKGTFSYCVQQFGISIFWRQPCSMHKLQRNFTTHEMIIGQIPYKDVHVVYIYCIFRKRDSDTQEARDSIRQKDAAAQKRYFSLCTIRRCCICGAYIVYSGNVTLTLRRQGTAFDRKMLQPTNGEGRKKAIVNLC